MILLNDMGLFVEVVRVMSFSRASDATGVPTSTLSRRISQFEKQIGLRLLHRTTRKLELTEAGQVYYQRCRRIVEEAQIAHEELGDILAHPSGSLRVSLPVDFASIFLTPTIAEFASIYPDISFDFDITSRNVDLISESIDVVIRVGEQPDSGLIARKLVQFPSYIYTSPGYLKIFGEPLHPSELSQHECLCLTKCKVWKMKSANEVIDVSVNGRFTLNTANTLCRFASLDLGIIMLPKTVITEDLLNGRLKRILPDWEGESISIYALTETRLLPAKTLRFIEFLYDKLNGAT